MIIKTELRLINRILMLVILSMGLLIMVSLNIVQVNAASPKGKPQRPTVSAEFPYESKYVTVNGSKMAYIETGDPKGKPVVFIHGVPTWSYLWRNVLPHVKADGRRLIAIDLMGFGRSEKAKNGNIGYFDHIQYLTGFVQALGLKDITFVLHDWGAAIGLNYAFHNPDNVHAIAFMEGVIAPTYPRPNFSSFGSPKVISLFKNFRDPIKGPEIIMTKNMFVEKLLPFSVMRKLTDQEMDMYREAWPTKESRRPIWRLVQDNPIGGKPKDVTQAFVEVESWWRSTTIPKLFIYASPGRILRADRDLPWMRNNLKNIKTAFVGYGIHFLQEDEPESIGRAINDWMREL